MKLLSIDPGIEKVGFAVFEKQDTPRKISFITSGLIKTKKTTAPELRLLQIFDEITKLFDSYKPDILIMEQLFFFKNQKTVIAVAQSQGAILLAAAQKGMPVEYLTPLQIKQTITGYGSSDKKSVHKMLQLILKQDLQVEDDDQSDAIACGLAYCYINQNLLK